VRRFDEREPRPVVAVEIGNPDRIEPALRPPDRRDLGGERQPGAIKPVDRERCAAVSIRLDHDDFVAAIAIDINDTRVAIFERRIGREFKRVDRTDSIDRDQGASLDRRPEHAVAVALGRARQIRRSDIEMTAGNAHPGHEVGLERLGRRRVAGSAQRQHHQRPAQDPVEAAAAVFDQDTPFAVAEQPGNAVIEVDPLSWYPAGPAGAVAADPRTAVMPSAR